MAKVKITKAKKKSNSMGSSAKKPIANRKGVVQKVKAVGSGSGPVTLKEAQLMVRAQSPRRARRTVLRGTSAAKPKPATPAAIGEERNKLERQQIDEIARRILEYKATLTIMKHRGVKGLAATPAVGATKRRAPRAAIAALQPLQIFAEGDSWFEYPVPLFGGGIIPRLEKRLGVPILNLAKAGDEVRFMLGVEERKLIEKHLRDGCPVGGAWDVMLFSGGGNDIVGDPMMLWIEDFIPSQPPAKLINQPRFDAALAIVKAGYEDLIELRNALSPHTHLVFHAYDFALPTGKGICHLGPWLKPTFQHRKFPSTPSVAAAVVKVMLQQFAAMLAALQSAHSNVTFINGQGTLSPVPSSWHNELHPSKDGFNLFADLFHQKLKSLFPNRMP